jgi:hypothetical protein
MEHRGACLLFVLFASLLISCEPSKPALVDARDLNPFSPDALCAYHIGDPEAGLTLFNQPVLASKGGCVTCHSMTPNTTLGGPSLSGIATIAEDRIEGVKLYVTTSKIYYILTSSSHRLDVMEIIR